MDDALAKNPKMIMMNTLYLEVAQWLSGRMLDSRPRRHRCEPRQHHCVVSLSAGTNTGSTQEDPSRHK